MRLTRHNGRSGKNGAYNPKHNDRRFDLENSEHIDAERANRNIYWDCYRGITTSDNRNADAEQDFSFEKVEQMYYTAQYGDFIFFQNERNIKNRHPERNRTVEDLLKNRKTCPEETIYQIGTIEESAPPEILLQIANDFFGEMKNRFGTHVHILNWALHLDEGTPHIQERMCSIVKINTASFVPNRKKHWRNWEYRFLIRTSQRADTTIASRLLMPCAEKCCLRSASVMVCNWIVSQSTVGKHIWRKMILSSRSRSRSWQKKNRHFQKSQ